MRGFGGSGDMFADGRGTQYSFNHVTAPYGFTLTDLVSYSELEGKVSEHSWNCGHEGPTGDPAVIETRIKQVRNLLVTLFLSQGIPVLNMGDEYGHSKNGMVDVDSTSFQWDAVESEFGEQTIHLISTLSAFRKRRKELLQQLSGSQHPFPSKGE
jgi:isoamylase